MKRCFLLLLILGSLLASCSRKTHPTVSNSNTKPVTPANHPPVLLPPVVPIDTPLVATAPPTANTYNSPMIVINEAGKVITSRDKLPEDIAEKVNYNQIARAFTPAQRTNLIYRFKMVPPRVLYIPKELVSKSSRGYYSIYRKKFWYWKKEDGLFYLDETYYQ